MTSIDEIPTDTIFGTELVLLFQLLDKKYNDTIQATNYKDYDTYNSELDYLVPKNFSRVYGFDLWHGAEFFCFCKGPNDTKFYFYLNESHQYFEFYSFEEFYDSIKSIGMINLAEPLKLY